MPIKPKKGEINYPQKLNQKEYEWLETKPFGDFNLKESAKVFNDFSTILYIIKKNCPNRPKILELGSGPGWLSIFLSQMGFTSTGLDIAPQMVSISKKRSQSVGASAKFAVLDIEDDFFASEKEKNDLVIFYDSLHHCHSDEKPLKNAYNYLKKNGILILAEPNVAHSKDKDSLEVSKKFDVTERGLNFSSLSRLAKKIGFSKVYRYHASGQSFIPRNESFSETLKMIFYPILARFYFGKIRTRIWLVAKK